MNPILGASSEAADGPPATALPPPGEIAELVASEVARQLAGFRSETERARADHRQRTPEDRASIVVFSGDLDRVLAAFVIATGAAAAGLRTTVFFTFWGLSAVKSKTARATRKGFKQKMMQLMTPGSSDDLGTSKFNFFGMGAVMLRTMMAEQGIASLEEMMGMARELGVDLMACTMSMDAMGVQREELLDGLTYGGVASFLASATRSRVSLFI